MKSTMRLCITITLMGVSHVAIADSCTPQDWNAMGDDLYSAWCNGNFSYGGGAVARYIWFRNDSSQSAHVSCDVWYDGGKKTWVGGTVRPGLTLKDGGNFVIAKAIEDSKCKIEWR